MPFVVCGGQNTLRMAAEALELDIAVAQVGSLDEGAERFADALPVMGEADCAYAPGEPDLRGAHVAWHSLQAATEMAFRGTASGLVTAPVSKSQLVKVGFAHPGQTEFLASYSGLPTEAAVMMLAGPSARAVPLTVHCALADVPGRLTTELIATRARIAAHALRRDFGIEEPRLAIAGLNPHAGENGAFGSEERDIIEPAIARLRAEGLHVSGPHAADAMFAPHSRGNFDAALCMYHDQALIPVKALDFDQGVNVTLGLPFIRTSPDHGTAFDIAGRGIADAGAMIAALQMAQMCADNRSGHAA